jgi:hypothetical protein
MASGNSPDGPNGPEPWAGPARGFDREGVGGSGICASTLDPARAIRIKTKDLDRPQGRRFEPSSPTPPGRRARTIKSGSQIATDSRSIEFDDLEIQSAPRFGEPPDRVEETRSIVQLQPQALSVMRVVPLEKDARPTLSKLGNFQNRAKSARIEFRIVEPFPDDSLEARRSGRWLTRLDD